VFVDGVNQYGPGAQYSYVETSANTVTFNSGLHVGAEVKFTTTQQQGAGAVDASQVTYDPPFTGSVVTNVEAKLAQTVSVQDFGAVGDGVTDDTVAIQAAFDAVSSPNGLVIFPNGDYKVTDVIDVTCNLNASGANIQMYNGGRFVFNTSYVTASNLTIEMMETFSAQIVQISVPHVTLVEPKISYTIDDLPLHTAINIAPPANPDGLWDVKVVRPYIRGCYIGIKLETAGGGSGGWITDVNISDATIIAFRLHGIRFNDAGAKGIAYCSVNTVAFENYGVNSLLKYGINCEGTLFGNSFTDIKDFNDDPLLGTYYTIYCVDPDLNTLVAAGGSPTLANHIMQFTRNVFSNCRIEGNISLGVLRNMYTLRDVHIYNKVGILSLDGYDYYHDYGSDVISQQMDLTTGVFYTATPSDATFVAEQNRLKVFIAPGKTPVCTIKFDLPQWFIDACNQSGYCTVAMSTDFYEQIAGSMNFNIRSIATGLPISGVLPSTNMRTDKRLVVITYNLSGITLAAGDYIYIGFTGVSSEIYSVNAMYMYTQLVNPVLDLTPYTQVFY
jgi:hypothetical protein